jgi:hypothetical protein
LTKYNQLGNGSEKSNQRVLVATVRHI